MVSPLNASVALISFASMFEAEILNSPSVSLGMVVATIPSLTIWRYAALFNSFFTFAEKVNVLSCSDESSTYL